MNRNLVVFLAVLTIATLSFVYLIKIWRIPRNQIVPTITSPVKVEREDTETQTRSPFTEDVQGALKTVTSPTVKGISYSFDIPSDWGLRQWEGGDNPLPMEFAIATYPDKTREESGELRVSVLHFESDNPKKEYQKSIDIMTTVHGATLATRINNNGLTVYRLENKVIPGSTDYYSFIESPTGYFYISGRDSSETERGLIFSMVVSTFAITQTAK